MYAISLVPYTRTEKFYRIEEEEKRKQRAAVSRLRIVLQKLKRWTNTR